MTDEHVDDGSFDAAPDGFWHPVVLHEQSALGTSRPHPFPGATISDAYACAALTGLVSSAPPGADPREIAVLAFAIADSMLIARRNRMMMLHTAQERSEGGGQ